jgi:hypothetical protein
VEFILVLFGTVGPNYAAPVPVVAAVAVASAFFN